MGAKTPHLKVCNTFVDLVPVAEAGTGFERASFEPQGSHLRASYPAGSSESLVGLARSQRTNTPVSFTQLGGYRSGDGLVAGLKDLPIES